MNKLNKYIFSVVPLILVLALFSYSWNEQPANTEATQKGGDNTAMIDYNSPFEHSLAFKADSDNEISKAEVIEYWNEVLGTEEPVEFKDFKIIFTEPEEYDKQYFKLAARSLDGTISIGTNLEIENGKLLLSAGTCTCKTTDCSNNGCEVEAGPGCDCSHCFGKCEKTHSEPTIGG